LPSATARSAGEKQKSERDQRPDKTAEGLQNDDGTSAKRLERRINPSSPEDGIY